MATKGKPEIDRERCKGCLLCVRLPGQGARGRYGAQFVGILSIHGRSAREVHSLR